MADNGKEESLTYMDQCRVVCLGYISNCGALEIQSAESSDPDGIKSLCNVVDQEIAEFGAKEGDLPSSFLIFIFIFCLSINFLFSFNIRYGKNAECFKSTGFAVAEIK